MDESDSYFASLSDQVDHEFDRLIRFPLAPNPVAFEIGANTRATSVLLSHHLRDGTVFSFEPSPSIYLILKRNVEVNNLDSVHVRQVAVGATKGKLGFPGESAYGHLLLNDDGNQDHNPVDVDVVTLDELVEQLSPSQPDFLKIDVEGFDPDVLKGGRKAEEKFRPLYYMEFNSWCLTSTRDMSPLTFARQVVAACQFVYYVDKQGQISRIHGDGLRDFLAENIFADGFVSNLIMTNDESRFGLRDAGTFEVLYASSSRAAQQTERIQTQEAELDQTRQALEHARRHPWKNLRRALSNRKR